MRALVLEQPGIFQYKNIAAPAMQPGHALLNIKRIGICGTDLHAFEGTQPYFNYPRILGHELAAELVDADGADDFLPGELVTVIPYFNCGNCIACRNGKPNCCSSIKVCGVHVDGGMVDQLLVPTGALLHGQGLQPDALALLEPLAIGAHGIARAAVQPGEVVLVMGAGPIGIAAITFAQVSGTTVIVLDVNEQRLKFCTEQLHVAYAINAKDNDAAAQVSSITNGDMPTVVIDCTGNQAAINNGLHYLAHGGRYVLIGLQKGDLVFSHPEFHKRETTLMSSRNATRNDFMHVMQCIRKGLVNPEALITHRLAFDRLKDNFELLSDPANHTIKAMVYMD